MSNVQEQLLRAQLGLATSGLEAERQLRLLAERRTAHSRVLWYELAMRLIPAELDSLRIERGEIEDPQVLSDDDLALWLKQTLDGLLFHYRQLISGREAHQLERLQAERDQAQGEVERLTADLDKIKNNLQAAGERSAALQAQLSTAQTEKADLLADLQTSRSLSQQARTELAKIKQELSTAQSVIQEVLASPAVEAATLQRTESLASESASADSSSVSPSMKPDLHLIEFPNPSDQTPAWYGEWLAATKPEERDRQSAVLRLLGLGKAFFRVEIIEQLNALGLTSIPEPDNPGGAAKRVFASLFEGGFLEEIDGGYGPAVPAVLNLTAKGRAAYQVFFGAELAESIFARLLHRHMTPEHTVLNLLARRVLLKFRFQPVDLFPDPIPLQDGAPAEPDIRAVAPDGRTIYLECERGVTVRSAEKRDAKWNRTAELGQGHLYLFVPNKTARSTVYSELSEWLHFSGERWPKIELRVCEYTKALTAPTIWTYATNINR